MLKIVSQNSSTNPLTPQMVEQVVGILNFPLEIYIARQLHDRGIKTEHIYPYLTNNPIMNNIFNAMRDFESSGLAHGTPGQKSVQMHKLPELGQFLTPELGQEGI